MKNAVDHEYCEVFSYGDTIFIPLELIHYYGNIYERYYVKIYDSNGIYQASGTYAFPNTTGVSTDTLSYDGYNHPGVYFINVSSTYQNNDTLWPIIVTGDIEYAEVGNIPNMTYSGSAKKPDVKVSYNGFELEKIEYKVSYVNNVKVGKAKIVINGDGWYSGTITKNFNIIPKGTSISKISSSKKGFTAKWKKQSTQTTGYQIRYSTSSKMSNAKTASISKNTITKKSFNKLKSKKKYYVQIRTYKTVNGSKYYSNWSAKKSVKTK